LFFVVAFYIKKIDNEDSVMAHIGFTVQDLLHPRVGLIIPPFLGSQGPMSAETQSIASLRVNVARAINKLKQKTIASGMELLH